MRKQYDPHNAFDPECHYSDELIRLLLQHGWIKAVSHGRESIQFHMESRIATLRLCQRRRYFDVEIGWWNSCGVDGRQYIGDLCTAAKILTDQAKNLIVG